MKRGQILGILALLLVCAITIIPAMAANETTPTDAATGYYNAAVQLTGAGDYSGAIALYDKALGSNTTMIRTIRCTPLHVPGQVLCTDPAG